MARSADLLGPLIVLARQAGEAVMAVYRQPVIAVRGKADASPVTEADGLAEAIILAGLARLDPATPVVAEEAASAGELPVIGERFWLVDPLDGTKEFINRNGEFTVNIALIEAGEPVLGVVWAPAVDRLFAGARGHGAFTESAGVLRDIHCRPVPADGLTVVASRSHHDAAALDSFLAGRPVAALCQAGSSLKLCLVACGEADLYPRFGRTMEWDIAAGHAVLAAAGGRVRCVADGSELRYGKPGLDNPDFWAEGATLCDDGGPSGTATSPHTG
jgi:3'(2'), 5'-bisphosphate nucleotidase